MASQLRLAGAGSLAASSCQSTSAGVRRSPRQGWPVTPCSTHVYYRQHSTASSLTIASSAYSRSSWRSAILEEQGEPPLPPPPQQQRPASGPETNGSREAQASAADAVTNVPQEAPTPCGLSAAELRVKLSLAAGSGRLDLTDARLTELPAEVAELTELQVGGRQWAWSRGPWARSTVRHIAHVLQCVDFAVYLHLGKTVCPDGLSLPPLLLAARSCSCLATA